MLDDCGGIAFSTSGLILLSVRPFLSRGPASNGDLG